jgi:hypothetical protein
MVSIGCGQEGVIKELKPETWDLLNDLSDEVWYSKLTSHQKITLGFQLFEAFPSYYHFLTPYYHAICNEEIAEPAHKELVWKQLIRYLSAEDFYADPVGYVLWVDFFEDASTVKEAWEGLIKYAGGKSLLSLLERAGPVPFHLKEGVYNNLLGDESTHVAIFNSLLFSSFDVFGDVDAEKALRILGQLKVDRNSEKYKLLVEKLSA